MSFESPVSVLYDEMGKQLAVTSGSAIDVDQGGIVIMGSGSDGWDYLRFNEAGELQVAATVNVDLKAYTDGGTDSITVHGDLAELRQEGAPGAERLMVSGAVDLYGPGYNQILLAVNDISGAVTNLTDGSTLRLGESDQLLISRHACHEVSGVNQNITDTSVEVLAMRETRQGATFYFEAEAAGRYCYIKFGGTASTTNFTVKLTNNGYYELPEGYGGSVEAIGNNANAGILYVSEWSDDAY